MSAALHARLRRLEASARPDNSPVVVVAQRGEPLPHVDSGGRPVWVVITGIPRNPMEVQR